MKKGQEGAAALMLEAVGQSGRRTYQLKLGQLARYFTENKRGDLVDEQGQLILPLPEEELKSFFGQFYHKRKGELFPESPEMEELMTDDELEEEENGEEKKGEPSRRVGRGEPYSKGTLAKYKAAIKWYYKQKKVNFPSQLNDDLDALIKGYAKTVIVGARGCGLLNPFEGKLALTYGGYRLLALRLMQMQPVRTEKPGKKYSNSFNESLFSWLYFVLQWNLIARSNNVAMINLNHMSWDQDSLILLMPKTKTDVEGENIFPRHIYANPNDPQICPILALGVYLCSLYRGSEDNPSSLQLFPGNNQDDRFGESLRQCLSKLGNGDAEVLGCIRSALGTHSLRKGAASYCLGLVDGPSATQIWLRAGWSLGTQDRYIFGGEGADQKAGRCVAGLPITDVEFTVLPPHFPPSFYSSFTPEDWTEYFPGSQRYPEYFRPALPFILASVAYHYRFLQEHLSPQHPFFTCRLVTSGKLEEVRDRVVLKYSKCDCGCGLGAKGVPSNLVIAKECNELKEEVRSFTESMRREIVDVLSGALLENYRVQTRQLTVDDLESWKNDVLQQILNRLGKQSGPEEKEEEPNSRHISDSAFTLHQWNGALHRVKESWKIPQGSILSMWEMWHCGDRAASVPPLSTLESSDIKKEYKVQWSRVRGVLMAIDEIVKDKRLVEEGKQIGELPAAVRDQVFTSAFDEFIVRIRAKPSPSNRSDQLSIGSAYEMMKRVERRKKKRMMEMEEQQNSGRKKKRRENERQEEANNIQELESVNSLQAHENRREEKNDESSPPSASSRRSSRARKPSVKQSLLNEHFHRMSRPSPAAAAASSLQPAAPSSSPV
jgi:hypothetical protein